MASTNKKPPVQYTETHGGAVVKNISKADELLRRSVLANMLWEDLFYEDGVAVVDRIKELIPKVKSQSVAELAIEARNIWKLRHVPLLLIREMARLNTHKHLVARTLEQVIQRPDELGEFLKLYWKDKKEPISAQVKKGLAAAFTKFDAYQLAKWSKDSADIKLRDVLFLTHAKPLTGTKGFTKAMRKGKAPYPNDKGSQLFKGLVEDSLPVPETWETLLSAGNDKKESWEKLLKENKLPAFALIKNLRNMESANVDRNLISESMSKMKTDRILPFRFIIAAKHAPRYEGDLEKALYKAMQDRTKLPGKTILIIDVSGSMYGGKIARYAEGDRVTVASSLAVLVREGCDNPVIYVTGGNDRTRIHKTQIVPSRRGFGLSDYIYNTQEPLGGGGIFLKQVMDYVYDKEKSADRIIVITDEQDCGVGSEDSPDRARAFGKYNYIINVSSEKNGIGYGKWTHISGWSESVLDYIQVYEEGKYATSN